MILGTNNYVKQNIFIIYFVNLLRGSCHLVDHIVLLTLNASNDNALQLAYCENLSE